MIFFHTELSPVKPENLRKESKTNFSSLSVKIFLNWLKIFELTDTEIVQHSLANLLLHPEKSLVELTKDLVDSTKYCSYF